MGKISLKDKLVTISKHAVYSVYELSALLPSHEKYGLTSQIRGASISISCNIVEGFARDDWGKSKKELLRFLEYSYGSLVETRFLLEVISKVYKIDTTDCDQSIDNLGGLIYTFMRKLRDSVKSRY